MKKVLLIAVLLLGISNAFGQGGVINGGALTQVVGTMSVVSGYNKGATVNQWNLQCSDTVAMQTVDCSSTTPTNVIGVAENINGAFVSVITNGQTLVNATAAVTIGHTVCPDPTTNAKVVDSGGTGMCSGSITIGTVIATSAVTGLGATLWDGVGFTPTTTKPLIDMTVMGGSGGSTGGFSAGGDLIGSGTSQSVVKVDFGGTHIPLSATAPTANQVLAADGTAANIVGVEPVIVLCKNVPSADTLSAADASEHAFATTCSIPASTLTTNTIVRITPSFQFSTGATTTSFRLRGKLGSTYFYDSGVQTPGTTSSSRNAPMELFLGGTAAPGNSVSVAVSGLGYVFNTIQNNQVADPITGINTLTGSLTVSFTITFGGLQAGNSVQLTHLLVEVIP